MHRSQPSGTKPGTAIAVPSFGYKSNVSTCRRTFGFIRKGKGKVTDTARFDGRRLRDVVTSDNTASDVWADTAYRSQANEAWLERQSRVIPTCIDQYPCAHWRRPIDMMRQG
jgi:hypothetical protein